MNVVSITIAGSQGVEYIIALDPYSGNATCTCPAYRYSKRRARWCKHIRFAAKAFTGSPAGVRLIPPEVQTKTLWKNEKPYSRRNQT